MKTKHLIFAVIAIMLLTLIGTTTSNATNGPSDLYAFIDLSNMEEWHEIYCEGTVINDAVEGLTYDVSTNTLTMDNLDRESLILTVNKMGDDFKIKLVGDNKIAMISAYGDDYGGSVTITGEGTLTIDTEKFGMIPTEEEEVNGIVLWAENANSILTIENTATVNIKAQSNAIAIYDTPNSDASKVIVLKNGQNISSNINKGKYSYPESENERTIIFQPSEYVEDYVICTKNGKQYGMTNTSTQYIVTGEEIAYDTVSDQYFFDPTSYDDAWNYQFETIEEVENAGYTITEQSVTISCWVDVSGEWGYPVATDAEGTRYITWSYYSDGEYVEYVYDISDATITLSDGCEYYVAVENTEVDASTLERVINEVVTDNFQYVVPLKTLNIPAGEVSEEEPAEDPTEETTETVKIEAKEEDAAAKTEVAKIINSVVALDEGTVEGIDEELADKIREKVENGETIIVAVVAEEVKAEDVKEDAEKAEEKVSGTNKKIVAFYDIDVLVKTEDETLGNVTSLGDKIKLTVKLPTDLPEVPEGYTRVFKVIMVHDGVAKELDATVSGENLTFLSDKFSTYAIAYEDTKAEETAEETKTEGTTASNPKTGDNIGVYTTIFVIATICLAGSVIISKKH